MHQMHLDFSFFHYEVAFNKALISLQHHYYPLIPVWHLANVKAQADKNS